MDAINSLLEVDLIRWIYTGFIILSGIVSICVILEQFSKYIGKPIKWLTRNNNDHEILLSTIEKVQDIERKQERYNNEAIKHDRLIKDDLENIKHLVYDQIISSWRFEILNMASEISLGKNYSKEQYDHIIEIHEKYDAVLDTLNQSNGKVTASMEVIMETYKEKLKNGF